MRKFGLTALLALSGLAMASSLPAANPELLARQQGIDDPGAIRPLQLAQLRLDVDVGGALAYFTLTAQFQNPSEDTLEGEFAFQLPDGAVVTGYALDIDEQMVDGVLVEPLKARRTYEAQVRQKIDPGFGRVSRANLFTTRVYPIPDEGTRTIRLNFSAPIHAVRGLAMPLQTRDPVGALRINVRTAGLQKPLSLTLPNKLEAAWLTDEDGSSAHATMSSGRLAGELRISPVVPKAQALASRHPNGTRIVHILDLATAASAAASSGRRLRVYWDRSLSRRDQKLSEERALLARYIAQSRPASIDLVMFNSSGARVTRVTPDELDTTLRAALYRGATSYAVLEKLPAPPADVCLVFTDGVATIDARPRFDPGCEVFAITSAADADQGFLRRLAAGRAGAVLNLRTPDQAGILARLAGQAPRVLQARSATGRELRFTTLEAGAAGWSVITESPGEGAVMLRIAGLDGTVVERRYSPQLLRKSAFAAAGALWAADRVAQLAAEDGAHEAFLATSRNFSVASPALSFLVLEDADDYVRAGIEPPSNYPAGRMAEYRESKAAFDDERRDAEKMRLAEVIEEWQQVVDWWKTDFETRARQRRAEEAKRMAQAGPVSAVPSRSEMAVGGISADSMEEVIVTSVHSQAAPTKSIEIDLADWDLKRPYLEALDAAAPRELDRVLAAQERKYGELPAFYFDVAEWLHRKQRVAEALEMLLSALDLPAANEQTASIVADRLLRFGRVDRAVWLLERAAEQTDYLPQPRRSLALALSKRAEQAKPAVARADLQRAVQLLNEVIMTPWEGDYDGIEVISLMEANVMLPRLQGLGVHKSALDPRLQALLDVDLRVVIEWNTGATDMDLWVDEPGGERAIYSNPRTANGGRLSNDMTQGFGPEEYLLRRSASGEYRVSVNVYAADSINPNGSTVVTARLFRDFGRPGQKEQTMEIELSPDDSGERLIGRFTVQ